ncbi:MAG: hypothetical protein U9N61_01600, partial [Euryarchaeota archaeon]|nr:hypothetical protein [Euryarchaeota archaeon]
MEFINADVVRKEVATVAELKAVGGLVKGQLGFATDDGVMVRRNQDDSFTEWESDLSGKQDILTAGDGIDITNDIISTTVSDEDARLDHFWSSTDVSGFDAELTGEDEITFHAGIAYIKDETTGKIVKVETTSAETIALGSYGTFYCYLSLDGFWRAITNRSIFLNHEVSIMYVTTLTEETFTILDVRHQAVDFPHASNLKSVYVDGYKKGLGANLTVDNLGVNL